MGRGEGGPGRFPSFRGPLLRWPTPALPETQFLSLREKIALVRWMALAAAEDRLDARFFEQEMAYRMSLTGAPNYDWTIREIAESLEAGEELSSVLEAMPYLAAEWEAALVRAGERSGALTRTLLLWQRILERRREVGRRLRGAAVYPILVLIGALGILSVLMVKVVPVIAVLFRGYGWSYPPALWALLETWDLLAAGFWPVVLALLLGGVGVVMLRRWGAVRVLTDRLLLALPRIGSLRRKASRVLLFDLLSAFQEAEVPVPEAFDRSAEAMRNTWSRAELRAAAARLGDGERLRAGRAPALLDRRTVRILDGVLRGGEPSARLRRLARRESHSFERSTFRALSILEPAVVLGLGLLVGWIVVAVYHAFFLLSTPLELS